MEYAMVPLALLVGVGFVRFFQSLAIDKLGIASILAIVLLIGFSGISAYPPREVLAGHEEGTTGHSMSSIIWSSHFLQGLVATDHRVSSILFGFGKINATWDTAKDALHSPSFEGAKEEMLLVESPSGPKRVDYLILDKDVKEGAMLYPWDEARPLSKEAIKKFEDSPYQKFYDSGYAQIYWVNWGLA